MLAGKDEELPGQQGQAAEEAALGGLDDGVAAVEGADVGLDRRGRGGGVVHFRPERVDVAGIVLEGGADFVLEVVDDDEVREKGYQVLDPEQVAALEEVDGRFDAAASLVGDHFLGDGEPEFFAEGGLGVRAVGDEGGEVDGVVFEGEGDGREVLRHGGVDVHAGLDARVLDAEAEGEVGVVEGVRGEGLGFEVGQEGGFGWGGVGGVDGDQGVVDGGVGGVERVDDEEEVAGGLVLGEGDARVFVVV